MTIAVWKPLNSVNCVRKGYNQNGKIKRYWANTWKNVGGIRTPINYEFPSETVEVGPFIYTMNTDGISDTMNSEKKPLAFGKKRLVAELEKNMSLDPKRTNKLVMDALNEYKGPAPFRDDITLFSFVFNNEVFKQS